MAKFLVFNVPAQGHINPTLPVVAELVRRGHQVSYMLTEGSRAAVEATGAAFLPYPQIDDHFFQDNGLNGSNPVKAAAVLLETSRALLPDLLELTQQEAPDAIIYDSMCPWGWLVAQCTGIPSVSSNSLLFITPSMILKAGMLHKLMGIYLHSLPALLRHGRAATAIRRSYGVSKRGFLDTLVSLGTITVSYTSALFQPESERLDETIKFVGPSLERRFDTSEFPYTRLDGRRLIYISLGTIINQNRRFYQQCFDAFRDSDYQVVLSVGKQTDIASLGTIPDNFIVRQFVPQIELLRLAHLFISHAGMNSVHEALYYNVPLLLVPQQAEQRFVAAQVADFGAGLILEGKGVNADSLRAAAEEILTDDSFKHRASIMGASFRAAGGAQRAADDILALVRVTARQAAL